LTPALVVLAGGMATRYGRLKQLDPVGPAGEAILDFTIHDAAKAGFDRAVIVVRDATAGAFMSHFDEHPPAIPVTLALQERNGRPALPDGGWKPWGTGHAVLSAATHVGGPFGVANGDDFYGEAPLRALGEWLRGGEGHAAVIGFRLDRTLSAHGGVTRAICDATDGWLRGLRETGDLRRTAAGAVAGVSGGTGRTFDPASPVSMNLWGFRPEFMDTLRVSFEAFRTLAGEDPKAEFLLPDVVGLAVAGGSMKVRLIETSSAWAGLTFAADRAEVMERLREVVEAGTYPRASEQTAARERAP
jgi:hypothetical protein